MATWDEKVIHLYRGGGSIERIATALELDEAQVERVVAAHIEEKRQALTSQSETIREIDQLDVMISKLWKIVGQGDIKAIAQAQRLIQRRSELVGALRRKPLEPALPRGPVEIEVPADASWYQMPEETSKAYAGFCCYRDAGPTRTMAQAWRDYSKINGLKGAIAKSFKGWAQKFSWTARVREFDNLVTGVAVGRSLDVIESARIQYMEAADDAAFAMIQMMHGHGADHARIAAARDILDRIGFVRQRAGGGGGGGDAPSFLSAKAENLQLNMNLEGMELDDLLELAAALRPNEQ